MATAFSVSKTPVPFIATPAPVLPVIVPALLRLAPAPVKAEARPVRKTPVPRVEPEPEIHDAAIVAAINEIRAKDPSFTAGTFLSGAKLAFELALKDIRLTEEAEGLQPPLVHVLEERLMRAAAQGHPRDDLAAVAAVA